MKERTPRMTTPRIDEVVLHHKHGGDLMEYRLWLEIAGGGNGWNVRYAHGPIGGQRREGYKTSAPVSCADAQEIKARVWDEQTRKGYIDAFATSTVLTRRSAAAEAVPLAQHGGDRRMTRKLELITNAFGVECYAYDLSEEFGVQVFDPTVSECGRFEVDPCAHYGLTSLEVAELLDANKGRDLYAETKE
jgi:hypothetical protein